MLHVDSDSLSQNEPKITTKCVRCVIIQNEIRHLLLASYLSIKLEPELPKHWNILEYLFSYLTHLHVCYLKPPGLWWNEKWKMHEIVSLCWPGGQIYFCQRKKTQHSSLNRQCLSLSFSLSRPPLNNLVKLTLETSTKPTNPANCVREGTGNNSWHSHTLTLFQ